MRTTSMRAFSLSLELQLRLENVIQRAELNGLSTLLGPAEPPNPAPETLFQGLRESDYKRIYDLLATNERPLSRQGIVDALNLNLRTGKTDLTAYYKLRSEIDVELKNLRTLGPKPKRSRIGNYSAVVEVLLQLGLDALEERSRREQEGSNDGHAGRPEEKQPKSRARKAVAA